MKELIKTLKEIKEHQMQTLQLAKTTTVYKLADKAIEQALSMGDVVKPFPEYNEILYHAKILTKEQFREYWNEVQGNVL